MANKQLAIIASGEIPINPDGKADLSNLALQLSRLHLNSRGNNFVVGISYLSETSAHYEIYKKENGAVLSEQEIISISGKDISEKEPTFIYKEVGVKQKESNQKNPFGSSKET